MHDSSTPPIDRHPRRSRWRIVILCLSALETLACAALIAFLLGTMGSDPLGRNIAQGVSTVMAMFLIFGALPALAFAWHGRFMIAATVLAFGAPLLLLSVWARL